MLLPQGVWPLAQLLIVPRPAVPVGEKAVRSQALPLTGPLNTTGVFA